MDHGALGLLTRAAFGGLLMGMANLVPGISGGTMLLAVGIYTAFITAIADVTTFRIQRRSLFLLGTVAAVAALTILFGAGLIKDLVIHHRWLMYSLFIGLTLGGVPLVWRLAGSWSWAFGLGTVAGFVVMLVMALGLGGGPSSGSANMAMLFFSGLAGAASMILPGVSGGYLLLLLGQYEVILGAIDHLKLALLGGEGQDRAALFWASMRVVVPVGLGVVVGVVGVSNLLKWLLNRFRAATLGVLMGLLVGAVIGLWPFQEARQPVAGEVIQGQVLSVEEAAALAEEDWPLRQFEPSTGQALGALGLVAVGLGLTLAIERLGRASKSGADG